MGMPILDDVNGPMRPGAGYINMNIAADGTRVSAVRAFLRPALSRPNLSLLLNSNVVKLNFTGTRCVGVRLMTDGALKDIAADQEVILAAVVRAIEAARELGSQHAFDSVRESELIPGPKASAEEIRELAKLASASFGHAVGTCKMGVDKLAVVDPELRVHGVLGLRVADASVMPQIITGPGTNASA